jgi:leucyl-tRNA synthetase
MQGLEGPHRFLNRVWRLYVGDAEETAVVTDADPSKKQLRVLHQTIQKVTEDVEGLRFNTAIAAMMEFVNAATKWDALPRAIAEPFVLLLSPFAPHLAEELWQRLGHEESLTYAAWPEVEETYLKEDTVELAVQVNGKVRGTIEVDADAEEEAVLQTARAEDNVARFLDGKTVRREIYVPGRIVNFVAN